MTNEELEKELAEAKRLLQVAALEILGLESRLAKASKSRLAEIRIRTEAWLSGILEAKEKS